MHVSNALTRDVRRQAPDTLNAVACLVGVASLAVAMIAMILSIDLQLSSYDFSPLIHAAVWLAVWVLKLVGASSIAYTGGKVLVFLRWFFFQRES